MFIYVVFVLCFELVFVFRDDVDVRCYIVYYIIIYYIILYIIILYILYLILLLYYTYPYILYYTLLLLYLILYYTLPSIPFSSSSFPSQSILPPPSLLPLPLHLFPFPSISRSSYLPPSQYSSSQSSSPSSQ